MNFIEFSKIAALSDNQNIQRCEPFIKKMRVK